MELRRLKPKKKAVVIPAIAMAFQSVREEVVIFTSTDTITATAATFTESKNPRRSADDRILGMSGFKIQTNRKEGRNIPKVAAAAPAHPPSW